ncbi:MAG: hypothetical protein H7A34_07155 [bacterium]|nr:hypothetical protein [bacterium]
MQQARISEIIYTDIARDGMMSGPNIEALNSMICAVSIPVIASGGISTKQDVLNLMPLSRKGLSGAIIGKALYTGAIDLAEVIACSQNA